MGAFGQLRWELGGGKEEPSSSPRTVTQCRRSWQKRRHWVTVRREPSTKHDMVVVDLTWCHRLTEKRRRRVFEEKAEV